MGSGVERRISLRTVTLKVAAGYPLAVLAPATEAAFALPVQTMLHHGDRSVRVWLFRSETPMAYPRVRPDEIGVTERTLRHLGLTGQAGGEVELSIPAHASLKVLVSTVSDIPRDNELFINPTLELGQPAPRWALMTTAAGFPMPVRVRRRSRVELDQTRASMLVRTLGGLRPGNRVQVSRLPPAFGARQRWRRAGRRLRRRGTEDAKVAWIQSLVGLVLWSARQVPRALDLVLRGLLRAPVATLRTTQANPGDDNDNILRLHETVFHQLSLPPGGQVLVRFADRQAVAVALLDPAPQGEIPGDAVVQAQGVERHLLKTPDDFPEYLVARASAPLRRTLGMPAATVITTRRRLVPLVIRNLYLLSLPVAGLFVAGAAIPEADMSILAAGTGVVSILTLLTLRVARSPGGPWP